VNPTNALRFSLADRVDGADIGPARVPLALLGQFQNDVSEFLKGSSRDIDPGQVQVAIEEGSLSLVASGLLAAASLWHDLDQIKQSESLDHIDPKRAVIVEHWQAAARQFPHRRYAVGEVQRKPLMLVNAQSNFRRVAEDAWVVVEKYLHGRVVDLGGKTKANVHLELENGATITVASSQDTLAKEDRNRLYRPALLHITAEENLSSGELRNLHLLAFADYDPAYDEGAFNRMVERGTIAWADAGDASEWIERLRGGGR
jgi:hypothetical protein